MSTPYRLGHNCVLYYSATALTAAMATAPASVLSHIGNPKVTVGNDTPEYTTRANNGVKQYASALSDYGISFDVLVPGVGVTDAAYSAVRDAFINKTEIQMAALSGASTATGSEGPAGNWIVAKFDRDEGEGKVLMVSIELKPSSWNSWFIAA